MSATCQSGKPIPGGFLVSPDLHAVSGARRQVVALVRQWQRHVSQDALDDIELLSGELIANAVRHTAATCAVHVRWTGTRVRVEVADTDRRSPRLAQPGADDEDGRGLMLLGALADSWGSGPAPGGKIVWFEIGPRSTGPNLNREPLTAPNDPKDDPPKRKPPVPYIARWSGEQDGPMPVVLRRGRNGIAYADERCYDRDAYGVLWERTPSQPGKGVPQFGKVHSLRQRLAMNGLRCQVCGGPADRNQDGVLWIIDARAGELLPDGESTAHPPVCRPCADLSVRACPHLRTRQVALRVSAFQPSGVRGALYLPSPTGPRLRDAATLRLSDPLIPWLRGGQLVMDLTEYALIDLNDPTA